MRRSKPRMRCRHFTGIQHDRCKAGVDYRAVRQEGPAFETLPCLNESVKTCELRSFLSVEEEREREEKMEKAFAQTMVARVSIMEDVGNKPGSGHIECPVCHDELVYAVNENNLSGSRLHVHAKCKTAGCLFWME